MRRGDVLVVARLNRLTRSLSHLLSVIAEPGLLHRPASRKISSERLVTLLAGIKRANPDLTLAQIGAQLEAMYERTPRGGTRWSPSSVKSLLDRAEKLRLLGAETL